MTDNLQKPGELYPSEDSGQTASASEEKALKAFAGMMRSCDRI